jgi:hypothetical protein
MVVFSTAIAWLLTKASNPMAATARIFLIMAPLLMSVLQR